jgi:hypothetical protein
LKTIGQAHENTLVGHFPGQCLLGAGIGAPGIANCSMSNRLFVKFDYSSFNIRLLEDLFLCYFNNEKSMMINRGERHAKIQKHSSGIES